MFSKKRKPLRYRIHLQTKKIVFLKEGNTVEIYITDLAAYNNGHLIGEWVSLPMDEDDLNFKVAEILSLGAKVCGDTEHEEIFFTDYECDYMEIGEYGNIYHLNECQRRS